MLQNLSPQQKKYLKQEIHRHKTKVKEIIGTQLNIQ